MPELPPHLGQFSGRCQVDRVVLALPVQGDDRDPARLVPLHPYRHGFSSTQRGTVIPPVSVNTTWTRAPMRSRAGSTEFRGRRGGDQVPGEADVRGVGELHEDHVVRGLRGVRGEQRRVRPYVGPDAAAAAHRQPLRVERLAVRAAGSGREPELAARGAGLDAEFALGGVLPEGGAVLVGNGQQQLVRRGGCRGRGRVRGRRCCRCRGRRHGRSLLRLAAGSRTSEHPRPRSPGRSRRPAPGRWRRPAAA